MTALVLPQSARWELPAGLEAAAAARKLVRAWLAGAGPDLAAARDNLIAIVSELAANAVEHGRPPAFLALSAERRGEATVLIALVHDAAAGQPRPCHDIDPGDERHRGLVLVTALASKWGVREYATGGKDVWCELGLPDTDLLGVA
jgi:anti-sigma regulatory factor (Ser/Thr protein kinase)